MNLATLRSMKPQILAIAAEHGVGNIRVFGSVARGDADETSDVDFLVTVEKPMGWDFYSIEYKYGTFCSRSAEYNCVAVLCVISMVQLYLVL